MCPPASPDDLITLSMTLASTHARTRMAAQASHRSGPTSHRRTPPRLPLLRGHPPVHLLPNNTPYARRKSPVSGLSQSYGPVSMRHPSSSMPLPMSSFDGQHVSGEFSHDRQSSLSQQLAGSHMSSPNGRGPLPMVPGLESPHLDSLSQGFSSHRSSYDFNATPHQPSERFAPGIPPSLWMSPTSMPSSSSSYSDTSFLSLNHMGPPRQPSIPNSVATSSSPTALSLFDSGKSTAPTSASSPKGRLLSDLFSDPLFPSRQSSVDEQQPHAFSSPKVTGSPDLKALELLSEDADPEKMAREDPLATQVWRMYARQKATLPHAQRMENLTWRMMALALKKKKEDEEREKERGKEVGKERGSEAPEGKASEGGTATAEETERGRTIDKGKAKVQVVGFDGENQDGKDEDECVYVLITLSSAILSPVGLLLAKCRWTGVRLAGLAPARLWTGVLPVALVHAPPWRACPICTISSSSPPLRHPSAMSRPPAYPSPAPQAGGVPTRRYRLNSCSLPSSSPPANIGSTISTRTTSTVLTGGFLRLFPLPALSPVRPYRPYHRRSRGRSPSTFVRPASITPSPERAYLPG